MVESVKVLPKEIQDVIEVHTWDVKKMEGIQKKKELGARTIPAIAVNGEVLFHSGIPQQDELLAAIRERLPK